MQKLHLLKTAEGEEVQMQAIWTQIIQTHLQWMGEQEDLEEWINIPLRPTRCHHKVNYTICYNLCSLSMESWGYAIKTQLLCPFIFCPLKKFNVGESQWTIDFSLLGFPPNDLHPEGGGHDPSTERVMYTNELGEPVPNYSTFTPSVYSVRKTLTTTINGRRYRIPNIRRGWNRQTLLSSDD